MEKKYIVRKFIAIEGGARHYYDEGIFSSYDAAFNFVKQISEEDDDRFLSEIVSYPLDSISPDNDKEVFTFDRKATLLITYDAKKIYDNCHVAQEDGYKIVYKNPEPESFTGKFSVGDLVFIRAFPWNGVSPTSIDTIGVIAATPTFFDEWTINGNDKYKWDNAYVVNYIRDGYIGHWHVEEKGMTFFNEKLPDNLKFLMILANHYLNNETISEATMKEILAGNIFIENVTHFDFTTLTCEK